MTEFTKWGTRNSYMCDNYTLVVNATDLYIDRELIVECQVYICWFMETITRTEQVNK